MSLAQDLAKVGLPAKLAPLSPVDIDGYVSVMIAAGEPVFRFARHYVYKVRDAGLGPLPVLQMAELLAVL